MEGSVISNQSESLINLSNSFLYSLILSAVDGVIAVDKTGKILIFNDPASNILDYTSQEALERLNIRDIYPGNGAAEIMLKMRSEEYGGKGKVQSLQTELLTKNGEIVPVTLNASIIYNQGKEVATIGFFRDRRESIKMLKELEDTQMQLIQAEKMASLGKLAAGVAHELNNPLNGITLFTRLVMEEYELADGARKDLTRVLQDAERCRDIIKELLEFARQTHQEVRPEDINKALSRTLFLLENQSIFQNIEIRKNLSESLPLVPVDRRLINHVFMNIILNAADAMDGAGILRVSTYLSGGDDNVCIEIADTGPGIPDTAIGHIFEPFFTTKDEGKGTGLGLSMAYGIVENHRGRIWAESTPGKGATFFVELPLLTPMEEKLSV